jgi:hypothetical protein
MRSNVQWLVRAGLASAAAASAVLSVACMAGDAPVAPKLDQWALYDSDDGTIIRKSRSGICHDWHSANFRQTQHYTAYRTMEDCVKSGGKEAR